MLIIRNLNLISIQSWTYLRAANSKSNKGHYFWEFTVGTFPYTYITLYTLYILHLTVNFETTVSFDIGICHNQKNSLICIW